MSQSNNNNHQPRGAQPASGTRHVLDNYSVQPQNNNADDKSPYYKSAAPSISLPKGGGALKSIDEKFSVNAINGTAGLNVPLPLTPGRGGFTPALSLGYNSGSGNSEFGLGWGLDLPSIQRKTDKKLPLYDDAGESDIFLLAGAEDLIPKLKNEADDEDAYISADGLLVKRYRPRIEGLFARIEFIKNNKNESWWRVTTRDNITTYYGLTPQARLAAPDAPKRIFKWLPELVIDNKGNAQYYCYKQENLEQVPTALHERNRTNGQALFNNLYLKQIWYCNKTHYTVDDVHQYLPALPQTEDFLMEALFDYGEHKNAPDTVIPVYGPADELPAWPARSDAFSDFHAGFEIRTYRRCQRVLMYHHFDEVKISGQPAIVRSLELTYQNGAGAPANVYTEADFITAIVQAGYKKAAGGWQKKALPAMTMHYQPLQWNNDLKNVTPPNTKNAPQGLTGPYQWTDLWGEGLPGILSDQGQNWWYKSNLGDGQFTPALPIAQKPSLAGLASGALQWQDLDADGRRQVVSRARGLEGFFELTDVPSKNKSGLAAHSAPGTQRWESFVPFCKKVNIDWNSPYTQMLDLNGDGRPDVLLTQDRVWTWFENEGKNGFNTGGQVSTVTDEEKGPRLVLNDKVQSIFLADMSGDGMTDIVRIKNGEVCYWPNMGYGKFGAKVNMTNAPMFDRPDLFNPLYLQLADISGTGAADLIYLSHKTVRVWVNLAGNAFAPAHDISTLPGMEPYSKVALLDFLGNGTGCIVWSSPLPQHSHAPLRYIDLMGGKKPYLMHTYCNGMGKTVTVSYKSSTQYYLADKAAGTPWATRLPFPVQCIDTITTYDAVSKTSFTQSYTYKHGYYDHEEREFRGFGRVDVLDTDKAAIGKPLPGGGTAGGSLDQPPVLTKTWYHTGAWLRDRTLIDAFKTEYYRFADWPELATQAIIPTGLSAVELREAYRALKGSALRQEVYALDGSAQQAHPYTVTVNSYGLRRVQKKKKKNRFASFLVYSDQSLSYSCERQPEDARLAHILTLEVDEYGQVTRSAQVAYPRLADFLPTTPDNGPDVLAPVRTAQQKMFVTYSVQAFTNDIGAEPLDKLALPIPVPTAVYRLRVPYLANSYELYIPTSGYPDAGTLWTVAALDDVIVNGPAEVDFSVQPSGSAPLFRLLSRALTLFADDTDLEAALPAGHLSALGIPFQQYTLAFTAGILCKGFGDGEVGNDQLSAGGYVIEKDIPGGYSTDDTRWWLPSGRVYFTATPAEDFYTPVAFADPWGNRTTVKFWDEKDGFNYWLLPQSVTDALGNTSSVTRYNWYTLQPEVMMDANENLSEICYDALGLPVATAVMGKGLEADLPEYLGTSPSPFDPESENETLLQAAFWSAADPETPAKTLLGKATWRCIYDLNSVPVKVAMIAREQHYKDNPDSEVVIRVSYTDGFGRVALNKAQCQPVVIDIDPTTSFTARWICSGKTIYNNKGKEVMQYEPFFCEHHLFNETDYLAEVGISPKVFYDPLGRAFRTDMPDGTYNLTTWDNWTQTVYDANDTTELNGVKSPWYAERKLSTIPELTAAAIKAYAHHNTPTVLHLDSLARPFFNVQQHALGDHFYYSYEVLDIGGNRLSIVDANAQVPLTYQYNLLNAPCRQYSIDGGGQRMLLDVAGQPLINWDADDRSFTMTYDPLRRPLAQYLGDADSGQMLSKTVYADGPLVSAVDNLRGQVIESCDSAGKHSVAAYDFKGQPLEAITTLINDPELSAPNWRTGYEPALSTWSSSSAALMDALGRPVTMTVADTLTSTVNITRHTYDKGGLLKAVYLNPGSGETTYVQDIHYDAKGQRQAIWYGNGTKTSYTYDPQTYRLTRLSTVNLNTSPHVVVQKLYYWYDAVGNITQINDEAQPTVFYNNTVIVPEQGYTYDALYRLTEATGRELAGNTTGSPGDNAHDAALMFNAPSPFDGNALQHYMQTYSYDAVGNIIKLIHSAAVGGFTRDYTYASGSNRLETCILTGGTPVSPYTYTHDTRGNMIVMPHLQAMDWNIQNQLSHVQAGSTHAYYQYSGGQRIRKTVRKPGDITEERTYFGGYEIYRKFEGSSLTLVRTTVHISDDTGRIAMLEKRTYGTDDSPASLQRFIYSNHLQSASLELDENGDVISYEEYHPYGTTAYQARNSSINAVAKRYRYTGKERDEESGLNYHGARYYALWLCRWVSVDPLESEYAGLSPYNYGLNNPITYNDPSGMAAGDYKDRNSLIPTVNSTSSTGRAPIIPKPANYSAPAPPEPDYGKMKIGPSGKVPQNDNTKVVKTRDRPEVTEVTQLKPVATISSPSNAYKSDEQKALDRRQYLKAMDLIGYENGYETDFHRSMTRGGGKKISEAVMFGINAATLIDVPFALAGKSLFNGGIAWGSFKINQSFRNSEITSSITFIRSKFLPKTESSLKNIIATPYGNAIQELSSDAIAAVDKVNNGATMYRIGTLGRSQAGEAQFWALENPLSNPQAFAKKYGMPIENIQNANFIEMGTIKPGVNFITRMAPPAPGNPLGWGGGIEVVVPANGVRLSIFSVIR